MGTGAFTAKSHVLRFLSTMSSSATYSPALANSSTVNRLDSIPSYTAQELSHADNSFTTLLNMPPYVLSSPTLDPLPSKYGHSDGEGIERNKRFIVCSLRSLLVPFSSFLTDPIPCYTAPRPTTAHLSSLLLPHLFVSPRLFDRSTTSCPSLPSHQTQLPHRTLSSNASSASRTSSFRPSLTCTKNKVRRWCLHYERQLVATTRSSPLPSQHHFCSSL